MPGNPRKNQIGFNRKTGMADPRRKRSGTRAGRWIKNFAQGNQGTGEVSEFSFSSDNTCVFDHRGRATVLQRKETCGGE